MDWKKFGREAGVYVVAILVVFSAFLISKKLFAAEIPATNKDAIMLVVGAVLGWTSSIVNYYFGSSKGSADKNDLMAGK